VVLILVVMTYLSGPNFEMRKNRMYEYGDVQCTVRELSSEERPQTFEAAHVLSVVQDGNRRLLLFFDRMSSLSAITFNHNEQPVFDWQRRPHDRIGQRTRYGVSAPESYWDMDMDGQFDIKIVFDEKSQTKHRFIFADGQWIEAEKIDFNTGLAEVNAVLVEFESEAFRL